MPDRDIKFDSRNDLDSPAPCKLSVEGAYHVVLTMQESREIFFQIGDQLGYTWAHHTEKKPAPAEPTPQARQDIAATATLHGMGYRWSDTNQWQPNERYGDIGRPSTDALIESLRTRITVLTQQAQAQDDTLHRCQTASQKMVTALGAIRNALGIQGAGRAPGGRIEDGVLEAVQELQRQLKERKQMAEVQQRANTEMADTLLKIHKALDCDEPYDLNNAGYLTTCITALQSKMDRTAEGLGCAKTHPDIPGYAVIVMDMQRLYSKQLELIRDVLAKAGQEEAHKWSENPRHIAGVVQKAIEALKSRNRAYSEFSVEQEKHVNSMEGSVSAAFAALKDHGYTPDRGETLGTLIRDAFGAEAAKVRQATRAEVKDTNSAWHRGHVVGYTSGKDTERQRCADIAQSAADRLDSAIALRIAQEIKNPA